MGASPCLLLYGRDPSTFQRDKQLAFDPHTCPAAELQDFVHTNIALAASNQKLHYKQETSIPRLKKKRRPSVAFYTN